MAIQIVVPDLGESVLEATIARWLKNAGDAVAVGEPLVVLETDKVDLEVGAERAGVLTAIAAPAGSDVKIGDVLGSIDDSGSPAAAKPAPAPAQAAAASVSTTASSAAASSASASSTSPADATPVARRMAQDQQVDLGKVEASGTGGRITKNDVQRYVESAVAPTAIASPASVPPSPSAATAPAATMPAASAASSNGRREERIKMSRRRRTIAQRLVEAQHTAAMLTTFNEIDMTAVQALREKHKERFKTDLGVGLGLSSFFVKAAIGALKFQPRLNAEIQNDDIVMKHYFDIGMAIGAPEGLVVPVLRDADKMSFADIEKAIKKLASQATENTLALDDLRGGTFTITNGGVFGSLMSTPIINPPQVGILGLHKIQPRPVALDGQVVIRPMMYVALSYDHRIVDGREAVQFLVRVKELIEDPDRLLIEG
ncbi:MAG: 2-oxoglutarate dehydrogenase complex dihydrolipoyllysine-residue succinyltransferase [Chloroflexota bacterium]|nr:2-oxoglutarate dehydrogenase complex dihydrolipoyllysine-residue succinyltransferase [Chloroflexota bacterium]